MAVYMCMRKSPQTWAAVLSASPVKTFKFAISGAAADGSEISIQNTDGTSTVLVGEDLSCSARRESEIVQSSLAGGMITAMSRLDQSGDILETVTGLSVLAGGPSKVHSFSRPPGAMSSLAWVLDLVDDAEEAARSSSPSFIANAATLQDLDTLDVNSVRPADGQRVEPARPKRDQTLVFGGAMAVGFAAILVAWLSTDNSGIDREKAKFIRPTSIPAPTDNLMTPGRVNLGRQLFNDAKLSANERVSCATCHDPERAYSEGVRYSKGVSGRPLQRHTPSLWNAAWGRAFFWDGRAPTLEAQAVGPIEAPDEMGASIEAVAAKLRSDPTYVASFAAAYPDSPKISALTIQKAIASFERSLVSPPTRFDRWIAGDNNALTSIEVDGFRLFNGRANCASCHSGWAFTDHGFHDVGLPGTDRSRGAILGLPALNHAFKTPSLRELLWTAPYMHDGSISTLEEVLVHYERGIVDRPSLSRDLPRKLELSQADRDALLAFLKTLSSTGIPKPRNDIEIASGRNSMAKSAASQLTTIGQKDKRFAPENVRIKLGEALVIVNNDSRPHNVSIAHPRLGYSSGLQEPGDQVKIPFPEAGSYDVFCGIHPTMRLQVEVEVEPVQAKKK